MTDQDNILEEIEEYVENVKEENEKKEVIEEISDTLSEIEDQLAEEIVEDEEESEYPWGGQKQKRQYIQFMTWMKSEFYQKYGEALNERDNLAIEMFWNYMKEEHMQSNFVPETMGSDEDEQ